MKKRLMINVSKTPRTDGDISYRILPIRERLLRFLLGNKQRLTILIPGDSVDEISICGEKEGGKRDGRTQEMHASGR